MSWFSTEWDAFVAKIESIPSSVQTLLSKLESDAGQIMQTLASTAAKDIAAGPLTTASYVTAAKDILAQLPSDGGILISDVLAVLNAEVSYLLSSATASPTSSAASTATDGTSPPVSA
jgi:hypothetical protein